MDVASAVDHPTGFAVLVPAFVLSHALGLSLGARITHPSGVGRGRIPAKHESAQEREPGAASIQVEETATETAKRSMSKADPRLIAKRNPQELLDWLASEDGFLVGLCTLEDKAIKLEPYQTRFLRDRNRFRIVNKGRQTGYSWIFAAEAVVRAHLHPGHRSVFVSHNMDDSKEKIMYAREIYEGLPLEYQLPLKDGGSKSELLFQSHTMKRPSRIISNPSKAPRGKGKADVYLDEFAHYATDRSVYSGSTALIVRDKHAQMTLCSTPLGQRGVFYEIYRQIDTGKKVRRQGRTPYDNYTRMFVPWWLCSMLIDAKPNDWKRRKQIVLEAPSIDTLTRVEKFGNEQLIDQFDSLTLEDFQQEYECNFVDEAGSFYPYDLLTPLQNEVIENPDDFSSVKEPRGRLVAGYDVARTTDDSALALFDERDNGHHEFRGLWTYNGLSFAAQEENLDLLMTSLPVDRLRIDQTGLGRNLAENMEERYPGIAEGVHFTNPLKSTMATDFKILAQNRRMDLPCDRTLISEIHSVERRITPTGKWVFESRSHGDGESPHADRFWAIALAVMKERGGYAEEPAFVTFRVIGV